LNLEASQAYFSDWQNSTTGSDLYDYYNRNLNASWRTDSGARNAMQAQFNALGGEASLGNFDAWADSQEAALRDPRINNPLSATYYMFENSGLYSDEELSGIQDFLSAQASGQLSFEAVPEWGVYDSSGSMIKRFGSEASAQSWMENNAEKYPNAKVQTTGGTWFNARNAETGDVYDGDVGDEDMWSDNEVQNVTTFEREFVTPLYSATDELTGEPTSNELTIKGVRADSGNTVPVRFDSGLYMRWRQEEPSSDRTLDEYSAWYLGYDSVEDYKAEKLDNSDGKIAEGKDYTVSATWEFPSRVDTVSLGSDAQDREWDIQYDVNVHNSEGGLQDGVKSWVEENKGNVVTIDGRDYQLHPEYPIRSATFYRDEYKNPDGGGGTYSAYDNADVLWVKDMQTGEWTGLNMGFRVSEVDTNLRVVKSSRERFLVSAVEDADGNSVLDPVYINIYDNRQ